MQQGEYRLHKGKLVLVTDPHEGGSTAVVQSIAKRNKEVEKDELKIVGPKEFEVLCKAKQTKLKSRIEEISKAIKEVDGISTSDEAIKEIAFKANIDEEISMSDIREFISSKTPAIDTITNYINEYEIFSKKAV